MGIFKGYKESSSFHPKNEFAISDSQLYAPTSKVLGPERAYAPVVHQDEVEFGDSLDRADRSSRGLDLEGPLPLDLATNELVRLYSEVVDKIRKYNDLEETATAPSDRSSGLEKFLGLKKEAKTSEGLPLTIFADFALEQVDAHLWKGQFTHYVLGDPLSCFHLLFISTNVFMLPQESPCSQENWTWTSLAWG